jgi:ubiquinone/menaquinone biosynthesis C-methylase UbiE
MLKYEKFFKEKLKVVAKQQEVLDVGGGLKFSKELKKTQKLFKNCHYQILDNNPDVKPDILADAHNIPLADESIDAVICKSVLEHMKNPFKVMEEIYRILKGGGFCLIYLPFIYPYHGNKTYKDYFRFTIDGVDLLTKDFSKKEIITMRGNLETVCYFFPKIIYSICKYPARFFDKLLNKKSQTSGFMIFLQK